MDAVKQSIDENHARKSRLRDLARIAECSSFRLCRAFLAATGMTMTAYRHSLRMRAALDRLRQGRTDLSELTLDLGYSSHIQFRTVFRRTFGMAPEAWRATARDSA